MSGFDESDGEHGDDFAASFSVYVPPEIEGDTYSNFLNVWH